MFHRSQISLHDFHGAADAFLQAHVQRDQLYAVRTLLSFGQQQSQNGSDVDALSEDEDFIMSDHRADLPRSPASLQTFEEFSEDAQGPGTKVVERFEPKRKWQMLDDEKRLYSREG